MPLVKATYKAQIKAALITALTGDKNIEDAAEALSTAIVDATDTYIRSATVTVAPGVLVATTGTAAAQAGATTTPGIGTIS
jgi:hypothetical protein